jgi:hypothetical protein
VRPGAFSLTGAAAERRMSERPACVPAPRTVANVGVGAPAARPNDSLWQAGLMRRDGGATPTMGGGGLARRSAKT